MKKMWLGTTSVDFTAQDSKHQLGIQLCLSQLLYSWPSNDLVFDTFRRQGELQWLEIEKHKKKKKKYPPGNCLISPYRLARFFVGWFSRFSRYENLDDPFRVEEKHMAKSPDTWPIYSCSNLLDKHNGSTTNTKIYIKYIKYMCVYINHISISVSDSKFMRHH